MLWVMAASRTRVLQPHMKHGATWAATRTLLAEADSLATLAHQLLPLTNYAHLIISDYWELRDDHGRNGPMAGRSLRPERLAQGSSRKPDTRHTIQPLRIPTGDICKWDLPALNFYWRAICYTLHTNARKHRIYPSWEPHCRTCPASLDTQEHRFGLSPPICPMSVPLSQQILLATQAHRNRTHPARTETSAMEKPWRQPLPQHGHLHDSPYRATLCPYPSHATPTAPPNPNLSCSLPPNYPENLTSAPSRVSYYRAGSTTQLYDPPPSLHHATSSLVNGWAAPMALHFKVHLDAPPTALSPVPRLTTTGGSMPLTTPTPPPGGACLPRQYVTLPLTTRRPPTGLSFPKARAAIKRLSSSKQHGFSPYPRASSHFATPPPSTTPPPPTGENSLLATPLLSTSDSSPLATHSSSSPLPAASPHHSPQLGGNSQGRCPTTLTTSTHCLHWAQTSIPDYDPYALESRAFLEATYPTIYHATPGWTTFPTMTHSTQTWAASITHLRAPLFHTQWFVAHWAVLRRHWQTTYATNVDHIRTTGELPLLTANNTIRLKHRYHDAAPMGHDRRIRARRAHLTAKTLQWHSRRTSLLQPAIPPPIGYADPTLRPPRLPPDPGLPPPAI
ncbi:hypothetical protein H257_14788 [Aphanomyces astaci]|uniref:Uncharacterized protein n=1 Tax=Aphanomyces astaci TaxID=112090 RepID=W4FQ08_APHAT|nr:hypothetical protein H257_14788 [Aphanomyces astaci]ETV69552.1 hypothetical protein H257_14788 [Aphanomyces astaci]|eukprot:XP_009840976.1 hypothetical protein H257_14788 [Aphanomyces astaci]